MRSRHIRPGPMRISSLGLQALASVKRGGGEARLESIRGACARKNQPSKQESSFESIRYVVELDRTIPKGAVHGGPYMVGRQAEHAHKKRTSKAGVSHAISHIRFRRASNHPKEAVDWHTILKMEGYPTMLLKIKDDKNCPLRYPTMLFKTIHLWSFGSSY